MIGTCPRVFSLSKFEARARRAEEASGASPGTMPNDGWRHDTVLAAAEAGDTDGVRALVDRGALINATREDKSCPLLLAAKGGHVDCCALLLELGADHSQAKEGGATPVFAAAAANATEVIRMLSAAGADVNAGNAHGVTPLQTAAHHNHAESVALLVELRADLSAADRAGNTALHKAARAQGGSGAAAKLLAGVASDPLGLRALVLRTNGAGQTALDLAVAADGLQCVPLLLNSERSSHAAIDAAQVRVRVNPA